MKTTKLIVSVIALFGCAALLGARDGNKELPPLVKQAVENQEMCIEIRTICPVGMPSFTTTDGYKFTVKDGKVNADLPFFGESHSAIIPGADNPGIIFKDCDQTYGKTVPRQRRKANSYGSSPHIPAPTGLMSLSPSGTTVPQTSHA